MDGSTIMRNLEKQFFGVGTSCIHGRFVQGEIWCKIFRLASGEVLVHQNLGFEDNSLSDGLPMKCSQAGCDVSVLRSTSDKPCKSILNILDTLVSIAFEGSDILTV